MKKISLLFFIIISLIKLNAQQVQNEIPFRLTSYNNIIVPVVLNKKDTTQLMFHTGSDYISLIDKNLSKYQSIKINDTIEDVTSWAGHLDQQLSINNQVKLGKFNFNKIPIFIDQQSGHESDGKIGLKFFENKFLEIDFNLNKLIVYNELPKHSNSYQKLDSRYENQTLFFYADPLINTNKTKTEFMLHTGYSGAIIFSDQYVKDNHLLEIFKPIGETKFTDAAGNPIISKKSILPEFYINHNKLDHVPISYFDSEVKIQYVNIFGGDLIKRFNWIISADLKIIYIKPNKYYFDNYFKI